MRRADRFQFIYIHRQPNTFYQHDSSSLVYLDVSVSIYNSNCVYWFSRFGQTPPFMCLHQIGDIFNQNPSLSPTLLLSWSNTRMYGLKLMSLLTKNEIDWFSHQCNGHQIGEHFIVKLQPKSVNKIKFSLLKGWPFLLLSLYHFHPD